MTCNFSKTDSNTDESKILAGILRELDFKNTAVYCYVSVLNDQ